MILCVRVSPAERKMQNEHKAMASTSTSWQERINVLEMDNSVRVPRPKLMMVEIYQGLICSYMAYPTRRDRGPGASKVTNVQICRGLRRTWRR